MSPGNSRKALGKLVSVFRRRRQDDTSKGSERYDSTNGFSAAPADHDMTDNAVPGQNRKETTETSSIIRQSSKRSGVTAHTKNVPPKYIPQADEEPDLAAQQRDYQQNLLSNEISPRQIDCRLIFFLDRKGPYEYYEEVKIEWQKQYSSRFAQIDNGASRYLLDKYCPSGASLYRIAGQCRLFRVDYVDTGLREVEVDSRILEKARQWNDSLRLMVQKFFFDEKNHGKRCKVELRWEYSSLLIEQIGNETFTKALRRVMREKMQKNWQGQLFLPRGDDKHIFTEATIRLLLEDDKSLKSAAQYRSALASQANDFSLEDFEAEIWAHGHRLLAVCIYCEIPLECLHRLMKQGLKDRDIPLENLPADMKLVKNMDQFKCDAFLREQGSFNPYTFDRNDGPPTYKHIDDKIVIPVMFKQSDKLGSGTFGDVYKATIYTGHHVFSANRDQAFAIKRWKQWDDEAEKIFLAEEVPLRTLYNKRRGNVVLHLASWSQGTGNGRRFYMLFPLAKFNLAKFLYEPCPAQDKGHVSWLFRQFYELTDAIAQIHTLRSQEVDRLATEGLTAGQPRKVGGFHHDLKPANILAFYESEDPRPTFKITDFGVAKLDFVLTSRSRSQGEGQGSFRTYNFAGDAIYCAPDYSQELNVGRKADIWSLGCCFLEMLLWNFDYGGSKLGEFYSERFIEPLGNAGSVAAYWYFDNNKKTVALKPAVVKKLEELQGICYRKGQFQVLVKEIEQMLRLKPKERQSAAEFASAFRAMHQQVEVDLTRDEEFYLRVDNTTSSTATWAPITAEYDTRSRQDCIDDQHVPAPYGIAASVSSVGHSRSASQASSLSPYRQLNMQLGDAMLYGGQFLSPSTEQSPVLGRPRAPSIEISDHSAQESSGQRALLLGRGGTPSRAEIPTLRRSGSGSSKSKTL